MRYRCAFFFLLFGTSSLLTAPRANAEEERSIRVFVALCDNKTQGIIPVGAKIGNGDDPDSNLYWGCSDGFGSYFTKSAKWKVEKSEKEVSASVLRRLTLSHRSDSITLIADAYRGSEIRNCYIAFEDAIASGEHDLVAFIGHNVLMDTVILDPEPIKKNETEAIVLACVSDSYMSPRLRALSCEPILMTAQLMYPGSFILHDAIESWRSGGDNAALRAAAGKAYAKNQKISVKAATGVFSNLATK